MLTSVVRTLTAASLLGVAAARGDSTPVPPPPVPVAAPAVDPQHVDPDVDAEVRYRINGKVRLLLFWASRDDVGSARLTWTEAHGRRAVALLAGSNPERAPSGLNQWIYLREESAAERSSVFAIRTVTDAESAQQPTDAVLDGPLYTASCAAFDASVIDTAVATVAAGPGVTYRAIGRLLDHLAEATDWTGRRMSRPTGIDVGFLTTLGTLMAQAPNGDHPSVRRTTRQYVYNHVLYDLTLLRSEALTAAKVGETTFPILRRNAFAVRNRTTGRVTRFVTTHVPAATGVTWPVQIIYQPNWWLRIELRVDDAVEAPPDPGRDAATLRRIRDICGGGRPLTTDD